jgi:hypothetical protein
MRGVRVHPVPPGESGVGEVPQGAVDRAEQVAPPLLVEGVVGVEGVGREPVITHGEHSNGIGRLLLVH